MTKESNPAKIEEGKKITAGLASLKYELQHDRPLRYVLHQYYDLERKC